MSLSMCHIGCFPPPTYRNIVGPMYNRASLFLHLMLPTDERCLCLLGVVIPWGFDLWLSSGFSLGMTGLMRPCACYRSSMVPRGSMALGLGPSWTGLLRGHALGALICPSLSAIVSMLDWYDLDEELILVMERPMPAEDLFYYIQKHKGHITMKNAKIMIKQLLKALIHLQEANIFHRDIKPENILIETKSKVPKLYLIDFGLSCFDDQKQYDYFYGTPIHIPPEFKKQGFLSSGPTNVWQVGVVLYSILHKKQFFTKRFLSNKLKINKRLSKKCTDFLTKCLTVDPKERPTLEELLHHRWLYTI
ncbi:PREDICTED: serine/threonine-protein kinase pim-3-like [Cyprinodon variegatus]|uniref:serine/threonine-protein kinase pim-3-like n=1 Tax=Cyprinodon variegatus TaxID=28743 RepID=UPI0007427088|nr:PREDICTED: serine/threonine-protein kinase pim-3-like [Cyprinodon variegatus]